MQLSRESRVWRRKPLAPNSPLVNGSCGTAGPDEKVAPMPPAFALRSASATLGRAALTALVLLSVSSCSFKSEEDKLAPPIYKSKKPRDPVESRVFYSGWRHPN